MITHSSKWQAAEYQLLQQAHNDYFKGTLKKKRKKKAVYGCTRWTLMCSVGITPV